MAPGPSKKAYNGSSSGNILDKTFGAYIRLLQRRPVLTKALTSAFTGALGNYLSQKLGKSQSDINWRSVAAFAISGFVYIGPLMHYFYLWLEKVVPKEAQYAKIKRILLDRFIFAPPFLAILYYILSLLEGQTSQAAIQKLRETFWPVLLMNWRVWTLFQFINVNYVPVQYRAPCASVVALLWNIYFASKRG